MCEKPVFLKNKNMLVGCGRCPECRKKRSREIFFRLACEMSTSPALFLTFTFDDEHLGDNILDVRDMQLFMKRLRKSLPNRKIKYYTVGEYGENYGRKHYHSIMFNVTYCDSDVINKCWSKGIVDIAPVENGSMSYVSCYVDKKLYGDDLQDFIDSGIKAPFSVCSRKLGFDFIKKNYEQILKDKMIKIGNHYYPVPRYYRLLLGLTFDNEDYKNFITEKHQELVEKNFDRIKDSIYMQDLDYKQLKELIAYDIETELYEPGLYEDIMKEFSNSYILGKIKCDRKRRNLSRNKRELKGV